MFPKIQPALGWPRRGITVLEVLIAIGVATVGLLGVIALLPIAMVQAKRGEIDFQKSIVGRNAYAEFQIRGMSRPDMWLAHDGSSPFNAATPQAFCIDPRNVLQNGAAAGLFPYSGGGPQMQRLTLRSQPNGGAMSRLLANDVFIWQDEALFDPPADATSFAQAQWTAGDGKRQTGGNLSWFATVAPQLFLSDSRFESNSYILSVVVVHQRDPLLAIDAINERVVNVGNIWSGGGGSGGVEVRIDGASADQVALREGQWVMLAGNTTAGMPAFRWLRVTRLQETPTTAPFRRGVMLQGADWNRPEWLLPAGDPSHRPTVMVIVQGAVAVYEKTIRLESTSLWAN